MRHILLDRVLPWSSRNFLALATLSVIYFLFKPQMNITFSHMQFRQDYPCLSDVPRER